MGELLHHLVWTFHFSFILELKSTSRYFNIHCCITWQKQNWFLISWSEWNHLDIWGSICIQFLLFLSSKRFWKNAAQFRRKSWDDSPPNGWYCSSEWWVESVPKSSRWTCACNVKAKQTPREKHDICQKRNVYRNQEIEQKAWCHRFIVARAPLHAINCQNSQTQSNALKRVQNFSGNFFPFFGGIFFHFKLSVLLEVFSVKIVGRIARNDPFWKYFLWKLSEASRETILLEVFSVKIVGSIARNARFGSLFCEISRRPRTKRSFWKLLLWNFGEASRETIILEPSFVKFRWSLARNDHFGTFFCQNCRKLRTKLSFWKFFLWNFEAASRETLVLEPSFVKFRWSFARNDHFGTFFCENCRKLLTKSSFWKLFLWNLEEASHETIILEASFVKIVGSFARNARFGTFFCEISMKPRAKRSFWNLLLWNFDEASHETLVLEPSSVKIVGSSFGSFFCTGIVLEYFVVAE